MVIRAVWRIMLSFDVLDKFSPSGKSIIISGAFLNRAAMWTIMLVRGCEVCMKIFNRIERFLDRASMNIAPVGLDNVHKTGMPSFDVSIKFVFPRKSERTTGAARIRAVEWVFEWRVRSYCLANPSPCLHPGTSHQWDFI